MEKRRRTRQRNQARTVARPPPANGAPRRCGVLQIPAPYLHDGRAATLAEAIKLHDGQAASSAHRFTGLSDAQQEELIAFLNTLRAPGVLREARTGDGPDIKSFGRSPYLRGLVRANRRTPGRGFVSRRLDFDFLKSLVRRADWMGRHVLPSFDWVGMSPCS